MKHLIVDLDTKFPECKRETQRQSIPMFACCMKQGPTIVCDRLNTCLYARGDFLRNELKSSFDSSPEPKEIPYVFVGRSKEESGFVNVWITAMPLVTQMKIHPTSVDDLCAVLEGKKRLNETRT